MNDFSHNMVFENLSIGYGKGKNSHKICQGLEGKLCTGSLTVLMGRNGIGKSTFLRTLAGFIKPIEGKIFIDGVECGTLSRKDMARRVAVVLTGIVETDFLTVGEVVAMGRQPHTRFSGMLNDTDKTICREALKSVNATHLERCTFGHLSDGEKQRVMIAKALAQDTPFILLDEPTAFLDYPSKLETMQLLRELAHEKYKSILLSCHDIDLATKHADVLWLMKNNHIEFLPPKNFAL